MYARVFDQLAKQISELQLGDQTAPGLKRIENSLRLLTPFALLLIVVRSQLKEFAVHADASALNKLCVIFTRLPRRSDAELMGVEKASAIVKDWIDAIVKQSNNWYYFITVSSVI